MAFIQKPLKKFKQRKIENFTKCVLASENDPRGLTELQIQKKLVSCISF